MTGAFDLFADLTAGELDMLDRADRAALLHLAESMRLDKVRASGAVPDVCGPEIPVAPARGPVRVVEMRALYPDGRDGWKSAPTGHAGRKTMTRCDALDVMEARAGRVLLTPGQRAMGRFYAALTERHASAGLRCTSLETRTDRGGGAGRGEFIDAVLRDARRLEELHRRIGMGAAMAPRARRVGADARVVILDRELVDGVFLHGLTFDRLLERSGWARSRDVRERLRAALAACLDRMAGPAPRRRTVARRLFV